MTRVRVILSYRDGFEMKSRFIKSLNRFILNLRNCIGAHQKLMIDVGTLLRTISKSEDYDIPEIANYLSTYKVFSERVSAIVNATMVDGGGEHSEDGMRYSVKNAQDP